MMNLSSIGIAAQKIKPPQPVMTAAEAARQGLGQGTGFVRPRQSGDPLKDQKAAERTLAGVAASRQQTYSDIYEPTSNDLRDMAVGKGPDVRERLSEVGADAASAFDANSGAIGREQRALGLRATNNQSKRLSLRRLISEVDARNNEAGSLRGQQETAQEYSIQQQASAYDQQSSIFGSIAQREAKRRGDKAMNAANQQSSAMGAAGMAVSIAAMFM